VTNVIEVPPTLDDTGFEHVLQQLSPLPEDARILFDARHVRLVTPYGLTALLTLAESRPQRMGLTLPESDGTLSYIARTRFLEFAESLLDLHGHAPKGRTGAPPSSVLLEVTRVAQSADVHTVVEQIQQRAQQILMSALHLDALHTMRFATTLSESCQNIVEHAQTPGWVAVQTYDWKSRLGRRVAIIAVCDSGIGFRRSLEQSPAFRPDDRWGDGKALEMAVFQGVSRFREIGRGQGLAGVRRYISHVEGKLSIRSGTSRVAIVPRWDHDEPRLDNLPPFPGSQLQIIIPERVER
jgi:anti-sigma regulatory factor (Ser/Thr protein kinase)